MSPSLEQEEMVIAQGRGQRKAPISQFRFLESISPSLREHIHPQLDDQAKNAILKYYTEERLSSATDDRNMMNRDDNINDEKVNFSNC